MDTLAGRRTTSGRICGYAVWSGQSWRRMPKTGRMAVSILCLLGTLPNDVGRITELALGEVHLLDDGLGDLLLDVLLHALADFDRVYVLTTY